MDDISAKIASVLNDPQSMAAIKEMAAGFMGDNEQPSDCSQARSGFDMSSLIGELSPEQLSGMMRIVSALNSNKSDDRTALLMALRPHLSSKRQKKLDSAVKLLKLAKIMPAVSESGLFKL